MSTGDFGWPPPAVRQPVVRVATVAFGVLAGLAAVVLAVWWSQHVANPDRSSEPSTRLLLVVSLIPATIAVLSASAAFALIRQRSWAARVGAGILFAFGASAVIGSVIGAAVASPPSEPGDAAGMGVVSALVMCGLLATLGIALLRSARNASHPPAAWYRDPSGAARQRYWDGRGWTGHTSA